MVCPLLNDEKKDFFCFFDICIIAFNLELKSFLNRSL